jgi:hypothetical protein
MTITFGFYNSLNGDRIYDANQISRIFDGIIVDGVFMSFGTALMVTPGEGLSVVVGIGRAWFNHTWTHNDALLTLAIAAPDMVNPRIDTVVLEVDTNDAVRWNSIKILTGTPASSPTQPTRTNNANVNQYPLAHIAVPVGATEFTGGSITNTVGTVNCPFVTGPLAGVNTSELLSQWEFQFGEWLSGFQTEYFNMMSFQESNLSQWFLDKTGEFSVWFNAMKDQLTADVAISLQTQINILHEEFDTVVGAAGSLQTQINILHEEFDTVVGAAGSIQTQINILHEELDTAVDALYDKALRVSHRKGGSDLDWDVVGNADYTIGDIVPPIIQVGAHQIVQYDGTFSVTFPVPFSAHPIVLLTPGTYPTDDMTAQLVSVTEAGFVGKVSTHTSSAPYHSTAPFLSRVNWMAIGLLSPPPPDP